MKKRLTMKEILDNEEFTLKEKEAFNNCIQIIKDAQKNDTIDAEKEIMTIIEGVSKNEI